MTNLEKRIAFLSTRNVDIKNVLDIGAHEGNWSRLFQHYFPDANILMIEANKDKEEKLKELGNYKIALLGHTDGKEVDYYKSIDQYTTGNTIYKENNITSTFVPEKTKTITLPTLLGSNKGYDLIKMDVQGSELDIIKGAIPIIEDTKFLILELSILQYNQGAPLIAKVIEELNKLNFVMMDILDFNHSNDTYLIQIDALFANKKRIKREEYVTKRR
jgi:FkbM family methyltransferase